MKERDINCDGVFRGIFFLLLIAAMGFFVKISIDSESCVSRVYEGQMKIHMLNR
jgi:hypothetical protein